MECGSFRWGNWEIWVSELIWLVLLLPHCRHADILIWQTGKNNICHLLSGAWSLEISHNHLNAIPSLAFSGLERSLWCLILSHNQFTRIPSDSISRLEKLNHLDLSGGCHCQVVLIKLRMQGKCKSMDTFEIVLILCVAFVVVMQLLWELWQDD